MNALFINQFIDCMVNHPIASIISILVFAFIFMWIFWSLRTDWELWIKYSGKWVLHGIFDAPADCYDYIDRYNYSFYDYKIQPISKRKKVKQIDAVEETKLKEGIFINELHENNRQIAESQEVIITNLMEFKYKNI